MGGNRVSHARWLWNFFVVWLLTGIWHGANWTFILWGMGWFVLLLLERLSGRKAGHVLTMLAVILLWVVFRSENVTQAVSYWASMLGLKGNALWDSGFAEYVRSSWTVVCVSLAGVWPLTRWLKRFPACESAWLCAVFVLSVLEVIGSSYNPFIYFNF